MGVPDGFVRHDCGVVSAEAARDVSRDALGDWYAQEIMGRTVDVSAGASVRMSLDLSVRGQ